MVDKADLTPEQKRNWAVLTKVLKCFPHAPRSPFEWEVWKRYHHGLLLPKPSDHIEELALAYPVEGHVLNRLLLVPDQSELKFKEILSESMSSHRAIFAGRWPNIFNKVFKNTGYEMFAGRTEWLVDVLLEGRNIGREPWLKYFNGGDLAGCIIEWLREGGYRQLPVVSSFRDAIEQYVDTLQESKFSEDKLAWWKDLHGLIFNYQDPESLTPAESPYYYFASRAQHYLCKEAQLPEPLEQYIIQAAKLNVSSLSEFKCLPILPRPACYDAKPVIVESAKSKGKKKGAEEEFYDEIYPAPDEDYPHAPLRYVGLGTVSGKETVELMLALFKQRKFIARLPKVSEGDPARDLSHAVLKKPPKKKTKAWIAKFKPHTRFAMSDELDLSVRILASVAALPVATTVFEWDEDTGEPCGIEVKEEQCNLALTIEPIHGEEIPDDSTLGKNIQILLAEIKTTLGIELHESVPPEHVPEG